MIDDLPRITWKVELDERGKLRWTYDWKDEHLVVYKEPQSTWGRRFMSGFYGILPIEDQL